MSNIIEMIECMSFDVPDCMKIVKGAYGYGLVSTKNFKKNDRMYSSNGYIIPNQENKIKLNLKTNEGTMTYECDNVNSVKISSESRIFYTFESFMNHSCDPTTYSDNYIELENGMEIKYDVVALKDINIGDQLTCDYLLFDYECDGHQFTCQCGYENCHQQIHGFKNLTSEKQKAIFHLVDEYIIQQFKNDNPNLKISQTQFDPNFVEGHNQNFILDEGIHTI